MTNPNLVFIVRWGEIENRLDPFYYIPEVVSLEAKVKDKSKLRLRDFLLGMASGATPNVREEEKFYTDANDGVPFLRVQNLDVSGELILQDLKYINRETHKGLLKRSQVRDGDLLIKITGVGRMAVSGVAPSGFEGNINQHIVVGKTSSHEVSEALAAFLNTDIGERLASRRATGGTRPALDYPSLRSIPIIFNEKLIDIFRRAYAIRASKEAEAQELLEGINSYISMQIGIETPNALDISLQNRIFYTTANKVTGKRLDPLYFSSELFDFLKSSYYPIKPLGNMTRYMITGFGAGKHDQSFEEEIIQIRPTNISNNSDLVFKRNIYIKRDKLKERSADILQKDEVLFNNTNSQELVGKSAFFDLDGKYFCSNHITRIAVDKAELNPQFLWLLLNLYHQRKIFYSICTNWNNQSGVNSSLLSKIKIVVPPMTLQDSIVKKSNEVRLKAQQLSAEGQAAIECAKQEVERMLLGEE